MTDYDSSVIEEKNPTEQEIIAMYSNRRTRMRAERENFEGDWDISDQQVAAVTEYNNQGKLLVNVPLEQNLIETNAGRQAGNIVFNVEPNGNQANVEELQPAKYALQYFIEQGDFYKEKKQFELDKSKYGTGVFYSGLTYSLNEMYEFKEGSEVDENAFWDNKNYNKFMKEKWIFTPMNVPLRNFWIDEKAIYQPFFVKARDCIMQENLSLEEVKRRWGDNKYFRNIDRLTGIADMNPAYLRQSPDLDQIIIHYYFNVVNKTYRIIGNYDTVLFSGKMLYKHGRLPFAVAQHYMANNCIYGWGIPRKVRYLKAYKSAMLQNALDKVNMSSGIQVGIGNDAEVDGNFYASGGEINMWRVSGSIDQVKQFQLDSNVAPMVNMLQLIDDFVIQDTGDNIKAPYSTPAGTLGEAEIMEENKQIRVKSIDESRDIALDDALTMTLSNITQFAPKLLLKTTKIDGELKKKEYPMIQVPNVMITKERGKYIFEEDMGSYGYFEFKDDTITSDLRVKVTTNSTKTALKAMERNSFTVALTNIVQMANIKPEILQMVNGEELWTNFLNVFGLDHKMNANTKKDKIRQENLKKIDEVKKMLGVPSLDFNKMNEQPTETTQADQNPMAEAIPQQPQANMGMQ